MRTEIINIRITEEEKEELLYEAEVNDMSLSQLIREKLFDNYIKFPKTVLIT
jgi:predicted HicB family RNase H-like nuclease